MQRKPAEVTARAGAECMTSGDTTPATSALATLPTTACSDEAIPRRSGTRSSTMIVTAGTMSAQPKEKMLISGSAHSGCGANSRLAPTLTSDTEPMMRKP